jgi:hypothetical protein
VQLHDRGLLLSQKLRVIGLHLSCKAYLTLQWSAAAMMIQNVSIGFIVVPSFILLVAICNNPVIILYSFKT